MDLQKLEELCRLIRRNILVSTTTAGSGHPTSSLSAVELMATLFFGGFLKLDVENPKNLGNDKVIFSKGHATPLLYSLFNAAGVISNEELKKYRSFDSVLEGHPTPRFAFEDIETGALGQGLSAGSGMALGTKLKKLPSKIYVLLGDSEMSEGQVWEAIQIASFYKLSNLVGILDVNRLGQRGATMVGWDLETYQKRLSSFGWETFVVDDGHDLKKVSDAFEKVLNSTSEVPKMIIAKTIKGKGVSFLENQDGWHGKAIPQNKLPQALKEIGEVDLNLRGEIKNPETVIANEVKQSEKQIASSPSAPRNDMMEYNLGDSISTREAYGDGLTQIGADQQIVALDAEVSNSTYSEKFKEKYPERFFEMFIAEQNMVSAALGLSKMGFIPFVSTFSAFLTRAFDQIRMAQYSQPNLKLVGSHSGVSIGQDGPSQMGLEDLAMMRSVLESTVFYPADAVSTSKLVEQMAKNDGLFYLRTTREKTPVIYSNDEEFKIGGSKILKQSGEDLAVVFTAGITLHEALKAHEELSKLNIKIAVVDLYSVKPIDHLTIQQLSLKTKNVIVVEDHYPYGGLGDAVLNTLYSSSGVEKNGEFSTSSNSKDKNFVHLAVSKLPRSGQPSELLSYEKINAQSIIDCVKNMLE